MIQCQICQVANEDAAQFCRECGGRLNPGQPLATTAANPPAESLPQAQTAPAKPRPKLHSPILGTSEPEPEPQPEESGRKGRGSSQSQSSSRKGLRSPLLGGGDDMDTEDEPEPRASKSSLRSPMLGGGGHGGSSGGGSKTAFPHRGDFEPEDSRPTARLESGKHSSKGLRSPLLGGSDFDPEESFDDPGIQAKASGQVKAHHRLRSPILGGSEPDYYEDEVFDEEVEEIEDPNVLRSPLLAVRSPRNQSQSSSHAQPASSGQPMPGQTTGQPTISPQAPAQAPSQAPAAPLNAGQAAQPQPLPPLPYQNQPPTQATAAKLTPSYQPQPAPLPSNSQYNLAAQKYEYGVNAAAANPVQVEPALSASAPLSSPNPSSLSSSSTAGTTPTGLSPAPAQLQSNQTVSAKSDSDEVVGPKDRRSPARERRQSRLVSGSSTSGNTSNNYDLDEDDDFSKRSYGTGRSSMSSGSGSGSNPMAPLLMASAAIALTAKGYVLSQQLGYPDFIAKNMPYVADQLATGFVFICLIIFAIKASQKN